MKRIFVLVVVFAISLLAAAQTEKMADAQHVPTLPQLQKMISRFAPTEMKVDTSGLSAGDRKAIAKLIEASRLVDLIQLEQRWSNNEGLYNKLRKETTPLGK